MVKIELVFFYYLSPIHDVSTAEIRSVSLGFVSLLRPVRAEITTVGYETDTPMSNSNSVVTSPTIIYRRFMQLILNIYTIEANGSGFYLGFYLHTCGRYLRSRLCSTWIMFTVDAYSRLFILRSCLKLKCPIINWSKNNIFEWSLFNRPV